MLTAELKVNGILIGHIYIHNEGYKHEEQSYKYNYHVYDVGKQNVIEKGTLLHKREEGAYVLVHKVLGKIK